MSFVAYRSIYYNTNKTSATWQIDILDTEVDEGQTIRFRTDKSPSLKFSGLPQDLKPGIYPTTLSFGMYLLGSPRVYKVSGVNVTHGPSEGFITDLFASNEGRFHVKVYKDSVHVFTGTILPDQCSFNDEWEPLFSIQAADGLYKLGYVDYISEIGSIQYATLEATDDNAGTEFSDVPLEDDLEGTEWVLIEHFSELVVEANPISLHSSRVSTYARYEQYSILSPGSGWVDQGDSLWAKPVEYFNEIIVDEAQVYHLTRDIDNNVMRPLDEYIRRAFSYIPAKDEYGAECMYDICNVWYETGMWDLTADPFTMIRLSERKLAVGNKWSAILTDILTHFYCRLYYSNGRYHIEQISERGELTIDRFCYDSEGTFIELEPDLDLDLSYSGLDITVESGGSYKFLAPLKNVKITAQLGSNNLLENVVWKLGSQATRYLARLKKTEDPTRFLISLECVFRVFFNSSVWLSLSDSVIFASTMHRVTVTIRIRITNIETGTTYHLTPTDPDDFGDSTWETDPIAGYFEKKLTITRDPNLIGQIVKAFVFRTFSEDLPGDVNDSFDVFMSVSFTGAFGDPNNSSVVWTNTPGLYTRDFFTANGSFTTVDDDKEAVNSNQEKVYEAVNNVNNSLTVEMQAKFCDTGLNDDSIEIKSSDSPISWRKSAAWNRDGAVEGSGELLQLLAQEILSLRMLPKRIYSGAFLTQLIAVENRIDRDSIIYLPLNVSIDTDNDKISGDFINLERETPSAADVLPIPFVGEIIPGLIEAGNPDDGQDGPPAIEMVFETNEIIADESTIDEVDIVNTSGAFVQAGSWVSIIHPTTGVLKRVKLTEDVNPDDTVMHFVSATFTNGPYPDASLIIPDIDEGEFPTHLNQKYYYYKENFTGDEVHAPNYAFPNSDETSPHDINKRIFVYRGGLRKWFNAAPDNPVEAMNSYYFNHTTKKFLFWIALLEESLYIEAF
jgi:hypothetical protein